jgi:hypothetical protein
MISLFLSLSLCGVGVESIALADFGGVFHAPFKLPFTERDATGRQRDRTGRAGTGMGGRAGPRMETRPTCHVSHIYVHSTSLP